MRAIALVVEYDGSGYHGFQRQSALPTIAAELEEALAALCGHPVTVAGAGRTDAGVHATGQVVSFETASDLQLERAPIALSALLREKHIAVLRAVERPPGFSARHDALARTYRYRILNRVAPSPLLRGRVFFVRAPLDLAHMRTAAAALAGTHDFRSFCAQPPPPQRSPGLSRPGTVRTIERISVERSDDLIDIEVTSDSFLHQMVRIIAGTLVEVGRGKRKPEEMPTLLARCDRKAAGLTAPAHGLYLTHVRYDPQL